MCAKEASEPSKGPASIHVLKISIERALFKGCVKTKSRDGSRNGHKSRIKHPQKYHIIVKHHDLSFHIPYVNQTGLQFGL